MSVHLRLMTVPDGSGLVSEWMRVVWSANVLEDGFFGVPSYLGPWWAGGSVEEYEHARIIHRDDSPTVSMVSKTEHGAAVLQAAFDRLAGLPEGTR